MHRLILLLCLWLLTTLFSACNRPPEPPTIPPFYTETTSPKPATVEPASTLANNSSISTPETTTTLPYPGPVLQATVAYPYPYPGPLEATVIPYVAEPTSSPVGISLENLEPISVENSSELNQIGQMIVYTDTAQVMSIDFSPDGNNLAFGNRDGKVYILSLSTGEVLNNLNVGLVEKLTYDPMGNYLAVGAASHIFLWELNTWQTRIIPAHLGANRGLHSIAISPDGKLIVSCANDGRVRLWDAQTGGLVNAWFEPGVNDVAFSPNGRMVATAGGPTRLWDYESGLAYITKSCPCDSVAISPNGDILASGGRDYIVRLWDIKTGELLSKLKGPIGRIISLAFSPDGDILAAGGEGAVLLWQVETGELLTTIDGSGNSITFNPEGNLLAFPGHGMVVLYGVTSTGK